LETILSVKNLSKKFGYVQAVKDLSFTIEKGFVYGILGPNGSGKSTTLGMVLNVVNPSSGSFQWFTGETSTHQALKKVGAIIERPNFYPYMSALQNLQLVCKIKEVPEERIQEKLELVGLWDRKNSPFNSFSLGMKQRLAIASALLNDPEILILDEPTNGLDPQGIHQIRELIRRIAAKGTTILLASHLLDEVEKVCSHVIILQKGINLYTGPVAGMLGSNGYFELKAKDLTALKAVLDNEPLITKVLEENEMLLAYPDGPLEAEVLNECCYSAGITLSHLAKRQTNLERQFLELTNA
jgi:ABC-2 type transport system ATP-binding protein